MATPRSRSGAVQPWNNGTSAVLPTLTPRMRPPPASTVNAAEMRECLRLGDDRRRAPAEELHHLHRLRGRRSRYRGHVTRDVPERPQRALLFPGPERQSDRASGARVEMLCRIRMTSMPMSTPAPSSVAPFPEAQLSR